MTLGTLVNTNCRLRTAIHWAVSVLLTGSAMAADVARDETAAPLEPLGQGEGLGIRRREGPDERQREEGGEGPHWLARR